ncbi:uncharacterized protein LOC119295868 isoform X1 [Triticum dicoccoides]|uniref:uncharacterized protein LOC119295868 isoform X1 n=1 Tax=Triticum dicoccoides TaxID=85692 RepID=UPI00188E0E22|nr:uncharacterized protein LOC119295868 isoform X1 [Triticum dicoccoides]
MADLRHHQGPQWSCLRVSFLRPLLLCPCPRHAMGLPTLALASRKGEEGRSNLPYTKQEEGGRGRRGARSSNLTEMAAPSSQGSTSWWSDVRVHLAFLLQLSVSRATPQDSTVLYAGRRRATNCQAIDACADPDQRSTATQDPKLLDNFEDAEADTKV